MRTHFPLLPDWAGLERSVERATSSNIEGTIWSVGRNALQVVCLPVPMGAVCEIKRRVGPKLVAEVIGFEGAMTLLAPLDGADGISPGDPVRLVHSAARVPVGPKLIGRVMDAAAVPMDELGPIEALDRVPLDRPPVAAMQRPPIDQSSIDRAVRRRVHRPLAEM